MFSAVMTPFDLRRLAAALVLASVAIVLAAFAFQYIGGLQPCVLCIWQRWPYAATIAAGTAAAWLAYRDRPQAAGLLLALCGLVFLAGAGIAAFHVGVEQHWWAGTSSCGGEAGSATSVEELRRQLLGQPVVRCDAVAWSLLGVSMAGWNMLLSLGLAALSFWGAFASRGSAHAR